MNNAKITTRQNAVNQQQHTVNAAPGGSARTAAGDALTDFLKYVFRMDGLFTAAGDLVAAPAGQTTARWRVLGTIRQRPMTVAQIARNWHLARQSVQRVADILEQESLVTYEDNPGHRRSRLVRLTPTGRSAVLQIQAAQSQWANELGERIGLAELRSTNRTLRRILAILRQADAAKTRTRTRA